MIGIYVFGYTKIKHMFDIYIFMFARKKMIIIVTLHMFSQKQIKLHRYLITFFIFTT